MSNKSLTLFLLSIKLAIFPVVFCYLAIQFHKLRNFIFKILFYCLSLLPLWCLYFISDFLYLVIYKLIRYRTKVVRENLRNSFPEKSEIELISIEKKFYNHFFDLIIESIKSISITENKMRKRLVFKNVEMFNKYFDQNKSLITDQEFDLLKNQILKLEIKYNFLKHLLKTLFI